MRLRVRASSVKSSRSLTLIVLMVAYLRRFFLNFSYTVSKVLSFVSEIPFGFVPMGVSIYSRSSSHSLR